MYLHTHALAVIYTKKNIVYIYIYIYLYCVQYIVYMRDTLIQRTFRGRIETLSWSMFIPGMMTLILRGPLNPRTLVSYFWKKYEWNIQWLNEVWLIRYKFCSNISKTTAIGNSEVDVTPCCKIMANAPCLEVAASVGLLVNSMFLQ